MNTLKIEILVTDGCSASQTTIDTTRTILDELGFDTAVKTILVKDEGVARELRFLGSPTVHINGQDVEPGADKRLDFGLG